MNFIEFTDNQSRIFIDTAQIYDTWMDACRKSIAYRGGMHWKKSNGRQYLFKTTDRYGNGKSLGPRNRDTEKIKAEFQKNKQRITNRMKTLQNRMMEQARFCRAARILRVPKIVTSVLKQLDRHNLLGSNVVIIGTNALYAYEAAAAVFFERQVTATQDMDILWDIRPKLSIVFNSETRQVNFLDILKKADKSFEIVDRQRFRAANNDGYMVDLVKSTPSMIFKKERVQMGKPDDLVAAEIMNLHWLLSSPKFIQIVIGEDGLPARMVVPDPRAFALHKIWVSRQLDRDPLKKRRDKHQGVLTAELILHYLPQYPFDKRFLKMFPNEVVDSGLDTIQ